jgi:hypothetical protein
MIYSTVSAAIRPAKALKGGYMIKKLAVAVGAVFLLVGLLGVTGILSPEQADGHRKVLGLFEVDGLHNVIHLLSGAAALAAGLTSAYGSRLYFQIFGAVYALVTVVGFLQGDSVLGLFDVNTEDNFLHLVLAALLLGIGFGVPRDEVEATNA